MQAFNVNNLNVSYGTNVIFSGLSFGVEIGDKIGIIGVNGCGKSTLLKCITGQQELTEGKVNIAKNLSVGYLSQNQAFDCVNSNVTLLERMYYGFEHLIRLDNKMDELQALIQSGDHNAITQFQVVQNDFIKNGGETFRSRCLSILKKIGFSDSQIHAPLTQLSGGQKTRLALAVELVKEPDILLLDEPTNHLDIATITWLEELLKTYKKTVVIVSHDRYFLDRITNKTLILENKKCYLYQGNYTEANKKHQTTRDIQMAHYLNQQKEIAHQMAYIKQQRQWNRERNIIAAESRLKLLDKMTIEERPENLPKSVAFQFGESLPSGNDVLRFNRLSVGYNENTLLEPSDLLVQKNECVFFIGANGCGKSTLLKCLLGKVSPLSGSFEFGTHVQVGYYDQENQQLNEKNTVLEELWHDNRLKTETDIRKVLALFRFIGDDVFKTVSDLSGGERARLTLAKLMLSKINLLIMDEPTNHLDIPSKEALETALSLFNGTILLVSHDRYFINKLASRIIEIKDKQFIDFKIDDIGNGYNEYLSYNHTETTSFAVESAESIEKKGKEVYLKNKEAAANERKKKNALDKMIKEKESLEKRSTEIQNELFGEASTDYKKASELQNELDALEEKLLEIYEQLEKENIDI